jgi:hypothetical protein
MKRTERRHLKDNELASLAATARETLEQRRGQLTAIVVGIVVIGAAAVGYLTWRASVQGRAHGLLAEAIAVEEARVAGHAVNRAELQHGARETPGRAHKVQGRRR